MKNTEHLLTKARVLGEARLIASRHARELKEAKRKIHNALWSREIPTELNNLIYSVLGVEIEEGDITYHEPNFPSIEIAGISLTVFGGQGDSPGLIGSAFCREDGCSAGYSRSVPSIDIFGDMLVMLEQHKHGPNDSFWLSN